MKWNNARVVALLAYVVLEEWLIMEFVYNPSVWGITPSGASVTGFFAAILGFFGVGACIGAIICRWDHVP